MIFNFKFLRYFKMIFSKYCVQIIEIYLYETTVLTSSSKEIMASIISPMICSTKGTKFPYLKICVLRCVGSESAPTTSKQENALALRKHSSEFQTGPGRKRTQPNNEFPAKKFRVDKVHIHKLF